MSTNTENSVVKCSYEDIVWLGRFRNTWLMIPLLCVGTANIVLAEIRYINIFQFYAIFIIVLALTGEFTEYIEEQNNLKVIFYDTFMVMSFDGGGRKSEYMIPYADVRDFKEDSYGFRLRGYIQSLNEGKSDKSILKVNYGIHDKDTGVWHYPKELKPLIEKYVGGDVLC